jgi:D-arabinose 1-dehydrogenase-like Zn-dependent alcohol dehydrogenase
MACFFEPVVAAYGVLNAGLLPSNRIAVLGRNRFSELLKSILHFEGVTDVTIIPEEELLGHDEMSFDCVIDAQLSRLDVSQIITLLQPGGVWILKSRVPGPIEFSPLPLIEREIRVIPVHYGSIERSICYLDAHTSLLEKLTGPTVSLSDFSGAVAMDQNDSSRKVFFDPAL